MGRGHRVGRVGARAGPASGGASGQTLREVAPGVGIPAARLIGGTLVARLLGNLGKKRPKVTRRKQVERIGSVKRQADLFPVRDAGKKSREEPILRQRLGQKRQVQHHEPACARLEQTAAQFLLLGSPQHRLRGKPGEGLVVFCSPTLACVGGVFQPCEIDKLAHASDAGRPGHIYQQVLLARKTGTRIGKARHIHDRVERIDVEQPGEGLRVGCDLVGMRLVVGHARRRSLLRRMRNDQPIILRKAGNNLPPEKADVTRDKHVAHVALSSLLISRCLLADANLRGKPK